MRSFEKYCLALRHSRYLKRADWFWSNVRPLYDTLVARTGKKGLERVINGTDLILIAPQFRNITERYEPETWHSLMREIRPGDTFADVGVFIGLYTIAVANRVGAAGRVVSFEPDFFNYLAAKNHVELNNLEDRIDLLRTAVGDVDGTVQFQDGGDMAHVAAEANERTSTVECVTLDRFFTARRVDVLKIDVEGYEEKVLLGAHNLLKSETRGPRAIYIEVHPYAWPELGTTSKSLLDLLDRCGYEARSVDGQPAETVERYGEIIARKRRPEN